MWTTVPNEHTVEALITGHGGVTTVRRLEGDTLQSFLDLVYAAGAAGWTRFGLSYQVAFFSA